MEIEHTETDIKQRKKLIVALAIKLIEYFGIYITIKTEKIEYKREIGNYYQNALYNLFPKIAEYLENLYIEYNEILSSNELVTANLTKMFEEFLMEEAKKEFNATAKNSNDYSLILECAPKFIVKYDSAILEYNGARETIEYNESLNEEFDYYIKYMAKKSKPKTPIFQVTNTRTR